MRFRFGSRRQGAFSIIEAVVAMAVVGTLFVALYSEITWGFMTIRLARENLRATQVMLERLETVRLYTWEQIEAGYMPATFKAAYYAESSTNMSGVIYNGTFEVLPAPFTNNYSGTMKLVRVSVEWESGHKSRQRSMETYVCQYGLQNYISF